MERLRMDIIKAKIQQATRLLDEMNIDAARAFHDEPEC
jgi:hypothetical protein